MLPRISLLLVAGILPLSAQSSLNDGDRMLPENQPTVQPARPGGPATMQPGVNAPPAGAPAPGPLMPAAPRVHCYIKEFTLAPSLLREGAVYKDDLKTTIKLNVPAPHRMLFHVVSPDRSKISCTDIVIDKNGQSGNGGISVDWAGILHDSTFEFKAFSADDPDTILYGRVYVKKKPLE
jgi:hypothetical protein